MQHFWSNKAMGVIVLILFGLNFLLSLLSVSWYLLDAGDVKHDYMYFFEPLLLLNTLLTMLNGIFFAVWMFSCAMNLARANYRQPAYKPAAALYVWLIPVANMVLPYQIMVNLFELYDELRGVILYGKSKRSASSVFIGAWWAFFIGGYVALFFIPLTRYRSGFFMWMTISELLHAVAAVFIGSAVIKMLTWEQQIRDALQDGLAVTIPPGLREPDS